MANPFFGISYCSEIGTNIPINRLDNKDVRWLQITRYPASNPFRLQPNANEFG
jgi:hypothetical protein